MVLPLILGALGSAAAGANLIAMSPWIAGAIGSGLGTWAQTGDLEEGIFAGLTGAALGAAGNALFGGGKAAADLAKTPFANAGQEASAATNQFDRIGTTINPASAYVPTHPLTGGTGDFLTAPTLAGRWDQANNIGLWDTAKYGFEHGTMSPGGIGAMMGPAVAPAIFPNVFYDKPKSKDEEDPNDKYPQARPLNRDVIPPPPGYNPANDPEHVYFNPTNPYPSHPYYASAGGLLPVRMNAGGIVNVRRRMADGGEVTAGNSTKGGNLADHLRAGRGFTYSYANGDPIPQHLLPERFRSSANVGRSSKGLASTPTTPEEREEQVLAYRTAKGELRNLMRQNSSTPTTNVPTTAPATTTAPPTVPSTAYLAGTNPNVTALRERLGITGPTYGSTMDPIRANAFATTQQALADRFSTGTPSTTPGAPTAPPPASTNFWEEHGLTGRGDRDYDDGDRSYGDRSYINTTYKPVVSDMEYSSSYHWTNPDPYRAIRFMGGNDSGDREGPDLGSDSGDRGGLGGERSGDLGDGLRGAAGGLIRMKDGGNVGNTMEAMRGAANTANADPQVQQMLAAMQSMGREELANLLAQGAQGALPKKVAALAMALYTSRYGQKEARAIVSKATGQPMPDAPAQATQMAQAPKSKAASTVDFLPGEYVQDQGAMEMPPMPQMAAYGGLVKGAGDGMSDHIPAELAGGGQVGPDVLLSDGEYVVSADVVSGLGNGSTDAGANVLDKMMANVRAARTGSARQPGPINGRRMLPA